MRFLVVLVLSATFLIQQSATRSIPRSIQYSGRDKFFRHVLGDIGDFAKKTLSKSKNYLKRSQTEIDGMKAPSQVMRQLNQNITALLANITEVLEKPKAAGEDAAKNFQELVFCFADVLIFPSEFVNDINAMELLHRNGHSDFSKDFENDLGTFLDELDEDIKIYLHDLSKAEKIKDHELIEWCNEFKKSPKDLKIRFDKAYQFFKKFIPDPRFYF